MIVLKDITIKFKDSFILQNISLKIETSSIHCIMGDSGVGKSMLLHSMINHLPDKIDIQGEITCPPSFLVPQDINEAFNPTKTISAQIANSSKTVQILNALQLNLSVKDLKQYPSAFSQGQLQRIAILMALLQDVKIILMDEPTAFLDEINKKYLETLILKLQQLGYTFIITTHDELFAERIADCLHLLRNRTIQPLRLKPSAQLNFNNFTLIKQPIIQDELIFQVSNGKISHHKKLILQNLTCSLYLGDSLVIIGSSGIGKTSLIKALMQQDEFKSTSLYYNKKYKINYVSQNYSAGLTPHLLVKENLLIIANSFKKQHFKQHYRIFIQLFYQLKLPSLILKKYPYQLSLGEKQRIILLEHLLGYILKNSKYQVLALDEITSSLSKEHQHAVISLLQEFLQKYHLTYILITHNYYLANQLASKILYLKTQKDNFMKK